MRVVPVPVREDNYAYILMSTPAQGKSQAVFVDPFDVSSVHKVAHDLGLTDDAIVGCIATHKHFDHAGGNQDFAQSFPGRPIWGGSRDVSQVTHIVKHGDKFSLFDQAPVHVTAYSTPCHTRESTCFFVEDERSEEELAQTGHGIKEGPEGEKKRGVFTGILRAWCVLSTLTLEYTESNAKFSANVLPDRPAIQSLLADIRGGRNNGVSTGLYTLAEERAHNPFMLVDDEEVQKLSGSTNPIETMAFLRNAKNRGFARA
ncbi:hydroxyacylglutathione hydrolase [Malassezia caprae]|uniref:Hydroxyacylglutathione hydrolase n=1 Tax=Malassezia caprae TaxID=1381934 RepID=A0AAF0E9K1_9BASI|nr:hydroxyacylglutathione hydrolase [Malassezia caprae]